MFKIIPLGEKILVKRRKVGEKAGTIVLPDSVKEAPTDLADVTYVPDNTFGDDELLKNATKIVESLTEKASAGDSDSLIALLRFNEYLKIKSIKPGDAVMISKYVGTDFFSKDEKDGLMTLVNASDVIGLLVEVKNG